MKERPILFSAPMVRAILDGRKTQTRRVLKPQPVCAGTSAIDRFESHIRWWDDKDKNSDGVYINEQEVWMPTSPSGKIGIFKPYFYMCPYGVSGDRLWVRETWQYWDWTEDGMPWIKYAADGSRQFFDSCVPDEWNERLEDAWANLSMASNYDIDGHARDRKWRPSIFMPRWASRINLDITKIRVERLQDISEEDAIAEGSQIPLAELPKSCQQATMTERCQFSRIWDSINGKKHPWESNPWVWVVDFNRNTV